MDVFQHGVLLQDVLLQGCPRRNLHSSVRRRANQNDPGEAAS